MKNFKKVLLVFVLLLSLCTLSSCSELLEKAFNFSDGDCVLHQYEVYKNVESTCSMEGYTEYKCKVCGKTSDREYHDTLAHTPSVENDYTSYQECSVCGFKFKQEPESHLLDTWVFDLDEAYGDSCVELFRESVSIMEEGIGITDPTEREQVAEACDNKFGEALDMYEHVIDQYYLAELLFNIDTLSDLYFEQQDIAQSVYNKCNNEYRLTLYDLFNSEYKMDLFGDDPEELAEYEEMFKYYGDTEIETLNNAIDEMEYTLMYEVISETEKQEIQKELVSKRNELAVKNGYTNYYEYATAESYGRNYTMDELKAFRENSKKYLFHFFLNMYWVYFDEMDIIDSTDQAFVDSMSYESVFSDEKHVTYDYVVEYLKSMKSDEFGIDMFETVNEAFKTDSIFVGGENGYLGAFSRQMENANIAYFSSDDYYSSPFTLVHEFGHMNACEDLVNDYDLSEIQSQANELLFLLYSTEHYASNSLKNKEHSYFEIDKIINDIFNLMLTAAVDELEYCIYTNYSDLDPKFEDGITPDEYYDLYVAIVQSYKYDRYNLSMVVSGLGLDTFEYYFADRSCYEISYCLSYIPTLEIYIDAKENFEKGQQEYFKVLGYGNLDEFTGDGHYLSVLEFAGLSSPFESEVYQKFISFFPDEE